MHSDSWFGKRNDITIQMLTKQQTKTASYLHSESSTANIKQQTIMPMIQCYWENVIENDMQF